MDMKAKMDEMKQDGETAKAKTDAKLEDLQGEAKKKGNRLSGKT